MPDIDIHHPHQLGAEVARERVEQLAGKLVERFGVECSWQGDCLNFSRSGVDGKIALADDSVRVTTDLGFLLAMMKDPIEAEIRRVLAEKF